MYLNTYDKSIEMLLHLSGLYSAMTNFGGKSNYLVNNLKHSYRFASVLRSEVPISSLLSEVLLAPPNYSPCT